MPLFHYEQSLPRTPLPVGEVALDIETTGLSPARNGVFLVGVLFGGEESDLLRQWAVTTDAPEDERALLEQTKEILDGNHVHTYNGDAFDLSFLSMRMQRHGVRPPRVESADLFRVLKQARRLFPLPNYRLQTVAKALHLHRQDTLSGSEVAEGFRAFLRGETALDPLLRHNAEDVLETAQLLQVLERIARRTRIQLSAPTASLPALDAFVRDVQTKRDLSRLQFDLPADEAWEAAGFFPLEIERATFSLRWNARGLQLQLPALHGERLGERLTFVLQPAGRTDRSPFALRSPFVALETKREIFTENLRPLLQDYWEKTLRLLQSSG